MKVWLDGIFVHYNEIIRLVYGKNEPEFEYFMAILSEIQNVLKISNFKYCVMFVKVITFLVILVRSSRPNELVITDFGMKIQTTLDSCLFN